MDLLAIHGAGRSHRYSLPAPSSIGHFLAGLDPQNIGGVMGFRAGQRQMAGLALCRWKVKAVHGAALN